jgi:hypothetical protein
MILKSLKVHININALSVTGWEVAEMLIRPPLPNPNVSKVLTKLVTVKVLSTLRPSEDWLTKKNTKITNKQKSVGDLCME